MPVIAAGVSLPEAAFVTVFKAGVARLLTDRLASANLRVAHECSVCTAGRWQCNVVSHLQRDRAAWLDACCVNDWQVNYAVQQGEHTLLRSSRAWAASTLATLGDRLLRCLYETGRGR